MDELSKQEFIEIKIGIHKLIAYVFLWFILNTLLIGFGVVAFSFMFEEGNFYGKGSTGIFLGIVFGMYKVHTKYFEYVIILKNEINRKNHHG